MKVKNTIFSERLETAMRIRNVKNTDICERSKMFGKPMGSSTISQYLSGKYEPKQDKIVLLSKILNVSELWLMGLLPLDDMEGRSLSAEHELSDLYSKMNMEGQEIALTVMRALAVTYKK